MTDQPSLLSWTPPRARLSDPETSHIAAERAALGASKGRLTVLRLLLERPMNDFELAAASGMIQPSIGKRRGECRDHLLVTEARDGHGEIAKGLSPNHSPTIIWQITPAGIAFYENAMRRDA